MRLILGWAMIVMGALGMTVHFWVTTTWLWHLLRREKQPFGEWFMNVYYIQEEKK